MSGGIELDLHVHYGFVWLHPAEEIPGDLMLARAGQRNGILGGAVPGTLSMMVGLHTGTVPFRLVLTAGEPSLGAEWEEIVEVDFRVEETELSLSTFQTGELILMPGVGDYRARYSARGMDRARAQDTRLDEDVVTDAYLLELWPAEPSGERVVREGSAHASMWARVARQTPVPVEPTAAERAAADNVAREERRQADERQQAQRERMVWRGVEPTPAMRAVGPHIAGLASVDADLAELVAGADDDTRRRIAVWAARQACARATDVAVDWQPALDALERGQSLPAPFDDRRRLNELLYPPTDRGSLVRVSVTRLGPGPRPHRQIAAPAAASATLRATQEQDAALAAIGSLEQAAAGAPDREAFYAEARDAIESWRS